MSREMVTIKTRHGYLRVPKERAPKIETQDRAERAVIEPEVETREEPEAADDDELSE